MWHTGADICAKLGGRWTRGHHGTCRCPAHDDRSPSLSVSETRDGRLLVFCHAGCSQGAVIDALRKLGLWGDDALQEGDANNPFHITVRRDRDRDRSSLIRQREAQDIWDACKPAKGTHAEAYLRARGIRTPVPDEIRFHPALLFSPTKEKYPAMVARLQDNKGFCCIQRTYLDPKEPKKANIDGPKRTKAAMLGSAVRLRMPSLDVLGLAEGIETAMSAAQLYHIPVWATLSAMRLGKIDMPPGIKNIMIFGDAGTVGREQAFAAQDIYEQRGLHCEVILPGADFAGADDYNDAVQAAR